MSTLMSISGNNGCIGRCDSKCYDAKEPRCDCICHGRNHGKGLTSALANTAAVADSILAGLPEGQVLHVNRTQMQMF